MESIRLKTKESQSKMCLTQTHWTHKSSQLSADTFPEHSKLEGTHKFKIQDPEIKIQKSRSRNQDPEIKIQKSRSGNQDPEIKIRKSRSRNQDIFVPEITDNYIH